DRIPEKQVVSRSVGQPMRAAEEIGRTVLLGEIVEHDEQLRHEMQIARERPLITMYATDIRRIVRQIEDTTIGVQDVWTPKKLIEQRLRGHVLEEFQEHAAGTWQMMHGAICAVGDTVLDLKAALLGVR